MLGLLTSIRNSEIMKLKNRVSQYQFTTLDKNISIYLPYNQYFAHMILKTLLYTLVLSIPLIISSQANLRLDYAMNLNFGDLESPKIYDFDSHVIFNDTASIFFYRIAERVSDNPDYPVMKKHFFFDAKYGKSILDVVELDSLGFYVFHNKTTDSLIAREVIDKTPLILRENASNIRWSYSDSTRTINGVTCHHAYRTHRGRTYDIWYSPEDQHKIGPWKLLKVPGLIYLASSRDGAIRFTLVNDKPKVCTIDTAPFIDGIDISFNDYWDKYLEQRRNEYEYYKNGVIKELIRSNLDPFIFQFPLYHNCFELKTSDISMLEKWATID